MTDIQKEDAKSFQNYYRHCGEHWGLAGDSAHNDRCPECNKEIQPYESIDITNGKNTNPKVHLLFFGANPTQWGKASVMATARAIDHLQRTGSYVISVGDKDDSDEAVVNKWEWFKDLILGREERGDTQDRWIVVVDSGSPGFRRIATLGVGNPTVTLFHHIQPGRDTYLYPADIPTHSQRPEKLRQVIEYYLNRGFNKQLQKDITMETKPTMTDGSLRNLLVGARQLIATWASAPLLGVDHVAKQQQSLFSPEHIAKELHNLRDHPKYAPPAMIDPRINALVNDLIPVFNTEVELNKEESNSFILRLDMAIDTLRDGDKPTAATPKEETKSISLAELHSTVVNAINLLSDPSSNIDRPRTIEYLTHVEAYLRDRCDQSASDASNGGIPEGAVARYLEQALGRLSNDFIAGQRVLEKKFDELARTAYPFMQNAFLSAPAWISQPYGPIRQPMMDSFPKMPDGFGFPNHIEDREKFEFFQDPRNRGLPRRGINNGFGMAGPGVPVAPRAEPLVSFDGIFLFHVEHTMALETIRSTYSWLTQTYPNAKSIVINYDGAQTDEEIAERYKKILTEVVSRYSGVDALQVNVVVTPSLATAPMDKINRIRDMLRTRVTPYTALLASSFNNREMLIVRLNSSIKFARKCTETSSSSCDPQGAQVNNLSDYRGVVMFHVNDPSIEFALGQNEADINAVLPNARRYMVFHPSRGNQPLDTFLREAISDVEPRSKTQQILHVVLSNDTSVWDAQFMNDTLSALMQLDQPCTTFYLSNGKLDRHNFAHTLTNTLQQYSFMPGTRVQSRY
jgi:hypothetical protein